MSWSHRIWQDSRTPCSPLNAEPLALGDGVPRGLAVDELDTARRAPRVAAARVQDVDAGVLLDGEHQALAFRHGDTSVAFHCQYWHAESSEK